MAREHVECLRVAEAPQGPWVIDGVASGAACATLSADRATGARTALLRLPPMWCWPESGTFGPQIELLVLGGSLRLGHIELRAGEHGVLRAGAVLPSLESDAGCELLWMGAGAERFEAATTAMDELAHWRVRPRSVASVPWQAVPSYEGRPADEVGEGLTVKFLHEEPDGGAYTLMTRHAAGWSDPRLEAHETWEELLLLEGDYLMGSSGVVHAGAYIFRPGARPHGPQATRAGAVWFCRGERRIDFRFTAPQWAAARSARYLSGAAAVPDSAPRQPWGRFS